MIKKDEYEMKIDNRITRNGKKSLFSDCFLVFFVVFVLAILWIYGAFLEHIGYTYAGDKPCSTVALAVDKIADGIFPWNYYTDDYYVYSISNRDNTEDAADTAQIGDEGEDSAGDNPSKEDSDGENTASLSLDETDTEDTEDTEDNDETDLSRMEDNEDEADIFTQVDESYFDDALFLGDSRMVGVGEYAGLTGATFYAKVSMSIYGLLDTSIDTPYGTITARYGLENNTFGKIYIMVGINEIGTGDTEYFISHYEDVINQIKEMQPDAIIYIQAIMHVTNSRARGDMYINNDNIDARNEALSELADNETVFFIDVNSVYDDKYGGLREDMSFDGVHLLGNQYGPWHDFLLSNAVVIENDM